MSDVAAALAMTAHDVLRRHSQAAPFLADWPGDTTPRRPRDPATKPVLRWLDRLPYAANAQTRAITQALVAAAPALGWRQTYGPEDFGAAFLDRYAWTELIGTRGPIPSATLACGFLMLGPAVGYPPHAHEAEELYLVVSGTALWFRPETGWEARPPGALVAHPPWVPHGMRTGTDPLLALYLWRGGDLAAKSLIVGA